MDKQLACATFATVIPVLLVAGYFSGETAFEASRTARFVGWLVMVVCLASEIVVIWGTGDGDPAEWFVVAGRTGALWAVGGMFVVMGIRLALAAQVARGERDRGCDHHDNPESPDVPEP